MEHSTESEGGLAQLSPEQKHAALFASLVAQQTNLALMFLGKVPHPEAGQTKVDLDGAEYVISLLEMLQAKTKGNLDAREAQLMNQSLTSLRMAFVEAVNAAPAQPQPSPAAGPTAEPAAGAPPSTAPSAEESHKKFSKKY